MKSKAPHVEIPFNEWSKDRLLNNGKCATTRTSKYGEPGDVFKVEFDDRDLVRYYELTHVVVTRLEVVARDFYREEGADAPAEFKEVWRDIHYRRGWDDDWEVYLHLFRQAEEVSE